MSALSDTTNNLYDIYVTNNIALAQSIVVKFDDIATALNYNVLLNTGIPVTTTDKTQWKYYQNISGQYNFSDTLMTVYSLDSENTINFDIPTLANNPVTKAAYAYGSNYYNDLLAAYPNQEMLILGILYPCDINTAINSPDGTILAYPDFLVESNEIDFINVLQAWIYAYINRWINFPFSITDNLYVPTYLAQLYLNLVNIIHNIRLAACKTSQAHSFHVKQYLRSHGFLDAYLIEMNEKQILNMYRNINYYERNAGFQTTFNKLIDVIFTDAGFPVYEYVMQHNTESLKRDSIIGTSILNSTAAFKRNPINSIAMNIPLSDYVLTEVLELSDTNTPYNATYQENNKTTIENKLDLSINAKLKTKVIETILNPSVKSINSVPDSILFSEWVANVCNDKYIVPVEYTPIGAIEPVRMTHQQALAMWIYCTAVAMQPNVPSILANYPETVRVPTILANRVLRDPLPTIAEITNYTDPLHVSEDDINLLYSTAITVPNTITSLTAFTALCKNIYSNSLQQNLIYSSKEDPIARSQLQAAATGFYSDTVFKLNSLQDANNPGLGITYSYLIQLLGLKLQDYQPVDYFNMALSIFEYATGSNLNSYADPTNIQAAMISLMTYLSSYSIQIVSSGISDNSILVDQLFSRVSNTSFIENGDIHEDDAFVNIIAINTIEIEEIDVKINNDIKINSVTMNEISSDFVDLNYYDNTTYVETNGLIANVNLKNNISTTEDLYYLFSKLTPLQRMSIVDIFNPPK